MASLKQVCKRINGCIVAGTPWIAVWKEGRSWECYSFFPEGGDYEDGYYFSYEDQDRMMEILRADEKAIVLNGEHRLNDMMEDATISEMVEMSYYNRLNQLHWFLDQWVIPD